MNSTAQKAERTEISIERKKMTVMRMKKRRTTNLDRILKRMTFQYHKEEQVHSMSFHTMPFYVLSRDG
jgi:hypothetical protein